MRKTAFCPVSYPTIALILSLAALACAVEPATGPSTQPAVVRCAVIGGMEDTGFWPALAERFEKLSGIHVEVVASGPKDGIDRVFRQGGVDLITMHSSDTIINIVADGFASDPQPWMRNDLVIVGPTDDPAGIKGEKDVLKAFKKIAATKANFVVHASLGAQEVLRAILDEGDITLDAEHTKVLFDDKQRRVLQIAADKKAYTLVGRIPFRSGKLPNSGLAVMVEGDTRLRRPYLVAVADPARVTGAHVREARRLAAFLRSAETQEWIATFGKGKLDDHPIFFPLRGTSPATRPVNVLLTLGGEAPHPLALDAAAIAAMPRQKMTAKDKTGKEVHYEGVSVESLLAEAGLPLGGHPPKNDVLSLCLVVEAADGYKAVFSLSELDEHLSGRQVLLADRREGQPINASEGPLRLIVSGDARPVRWVRQVIALRVERP